MGANRPRVGASPGAKGEGGQREGGERQTDDDDDLERAGTAVGGGAEEKLDPCWTEEGEDCSCSSKDAQRGLDPEAGGQDGRGRDA